MAQACGPLLNARSKMALAEEEEREVHGTIWLVDQMVIAGRITPKRARQAYDAMRKSGRRLPWDEVEQQLHTLSK